MLLSFFFFSSRRRHTRFDCDWSSDVCSSDLTLPGVEVRDCSRQQQQRGGKDWRDYAGGVELERQMRGLALEQDRKSGVEGKRVDLGGRRIIKKKKRKTGRRGG